MALVSGLGTGIAQSAVFISIQVAVTPDHVASAISALYLATGIGAVVGLACTSAATQEVLRRTLATRLGGLELDDNQRSEVCYFDLGRF